MLVPCLDHAGTVLGILGVGVNGGPESENLEIQWLPFFSIINSPNMTWLKFLGQIRILNLFPGQK